MKKINNKSRLNIPEGFSEEDIKIDSSTCTGEKTIGFFSKAENKLMYAELVTSTDDIDKFYKKYGIKRKQEKP